MSQSFCGPCGKIHTKPVNEHCMQAAPPVRRATRSQVGREVAAVKTENTGACGGVGIMAEGGVSADKKGVERERREMLRAESVDRTRRESRLLIEGTERTRHEARRLAESIAEMEKEKQLAVLKARQAALAEEMAALRVDNGRRGRSRSASGERRRHRRRRYSSSSSSGERTPSRERRIRSKWSLKRFTEDRKEVKKLNANEVIEATCAWLADKDNLCVEEVLGVVKHIGYMAGKAKADRYTDSAHARFDIAVRKRAAKHGFAAFSAENSEASLKYYALEYMKERKSGGAGKGGGAAKQLFTRDGKRPCFGFNKEGGCSRDEKTCSYGHWCSKCGSRAHKRTSCYKD